jgi:hypothetical protein
MGAWGVRTEDSDETHDLVAEVGLDGFSRGVAVSSSSLRKAARRLDAIVCPRKFLRKYEYGTPHHHPIYRSAFTA